MTADKGRNGPEPTLPFTEEPGAPADDDFVPPTAAGLHPAAVPPAPRTAPGTRDRPFTIAALNGTARDLLERSIGDVWLQGEISNFKPHGSGHWYFSLKDDRAQIAAVMFRSSNVLLKFRPEDGLAVLARARVTLYEPRGVYQINIQHMEPLGAGALQIAFEQLKAKLKAEGLFDLERKKPIPPLPRRVGLVTSPTGAALRDVLRVLQLRSAGLDVLIAPCLVQGAAAAPQIADAIRRMNEWSARHPDRGVDVVILARGGGSLEDLWPFNEEIVARAIAASALPIVSAVGHETDVTIADFAADARAATPSAAAEMVIRSRAELLARVASAGARLLHGVRLGVLSRRNRVQSLAASSGFARAQAMLAEAQQRHDEARAGLLRGLEVRIRALRERLALARQRLSPRSLKAELAARRGRMGAAAELLGRSMRGRMRALREEVDRRRALLDSLSPLAVLDRGYAIVHDETAGRVVADAGRLKAGGMVAVQVARGRFGATVTWVEPSDAPPGKGRGR